MLSAKQGSIWFHFHNIFGMTRSGIEPTTSAYGANARPLSHLPVMSGGRHKNTNTVSSNRKEASMPCKMGIKPKRHIHNAPTVKD